MASRTGAPGSGNSSSLGLPSANRNRVSCLTVLLKASQLKLSASRSVSTYGSVFTHVLSANCWWTNSANLGHPSASSSMRSST